MITDDEFSVLMIAARTELTARDTPRSARLAWRQDARR